MTNEEVMKKNGGKKFDVCLMNPPYSRGLHLRFLEKTIELCDNVISVQPYLWLQAGNRKKSNSTYYKYENSISKHIHDLEIIEAADAKRLFGVLIDRVGIYTCNDEGGFNYKDAFSNKIVEDAIQYIQKNLCTIDKNKKDGYRIRIPGMAGAGSGGSGERPPWLGGIAIKDIVFKDGKYDGKWWYEYYVRNQNSKTTEEISLSIKFDSEEEGHNFARQFNTKFVKYIDHFIFNNAAVEDSRILWMGNAKHPRTGTLGYKDEWTDSDFYKFFELSDDEINTIEDFIDNNEKEMDKWYKEHNKVRHK